MLEAKSHEAAAMLFEGDPHFMIFPAIRSRSWNNLPFRYVCWPAGPMPNQEVNSASSDHASFGHERAQPGLLLRTEVDRLGGDGADACRLALGGPPAEEPPQEAGRVVAHGGDCTRAAMAAT